MENISYVMGSLQRTLDYRQNRIADQVANANTTAFKVEKDIIIENDIRVGRGRGKGVVNKHHFSKIGSTYRDYTQGNLEVTNRELDIAISGEGFFKVSTPAGDRYTRVGSMLKNSNGSLVTKDGHPFLGPGGQEIILLPEDTNIEVRENGIVSANGEERGQIGVFIFDNEQLLERFGNGLYSTEQNSIIYEDSKIVHGALEQSNVNSIEQMNDLINISHKFSNVKNLVKMLHEQSLNTMDTLSRE